MKRTLVAYIAAIFVAGNAPTLLGANLLTNSGFESGALSPWFQDRVVTGGENWNVTTADAHSGFYSATNTGNKEIRDTFSPVLVQNIKNISFWAKHVGQGDAMFVDLFFDNGAERNTTVSVAANNTWQLIDVTAPAASPGALGTKVTGFSLFGNSLGDPQFTRDVSRRRHDHRPRALHRRAARDRLCCGVGGCGCIRFSPPLLPEWQLQDAAGIGRGVGASRDWSQLSVLWRIRRGIRRLKFGAICKILLALLPLGNSAAITGVKCRENFGCCFRRATALAFVGASNWSYAISSIISRPGEFRACVGAAIKR